MKITLSTYNSNIKVRAATKKHRKWTTKGLQQARKQRKGKLLIELNIIYFYLLVIWTKAKRKEKPGEAQVPKMMQVFKKLNSFYIFCFSLPKVKPSLVEQKHQIAAKLISVLVSLFQDLHSWPQQPSEIKPWLTMKYRSNAYRKENSKCQVLKISNHFIA